MTSVVLTKSGSENRPLIPGLKKGQIIEIDEYEIKYKYKKQNE